MNLSLFRIIPAAILIVLGIVVMAVATFGVFRIKYVLNRMHSSAMIDSLGMLLIAAGLGILYGLTMPTLKLIFIVTLFWCASPVCAHLLIDLETDTNEKLERHCEILPLTAVEEEMRRREEAAEVQPHADAAEQSMHTEGGAEA